jgi:hypothetical protein
MSEQKLEPTAAQLKAADSILANVTRQVTGVTDVAESQAIYIATNRLAALRLPPEICEQLMTRITEGITRAFDERASKIKPVLSSAVDKIIEG